MKIVRHKSARSFLERAGAWLERSEAENNLLLGIAERVASRPERFSTAPWFFTVEREGAIAGVAAMTPPWKLVIARAQDGALGALAGWLREAGAPVPGVLGPTEDARRFAEAWAARTGVRPRPGLRERIYACERVIAPARPAPGRLRPARAAETPLLADWAHRFHEETGSTDPGDPLEIVRGMLADARLFVWDDGGAPVSCAARAGPTRHGVRLAFVYTPGPLRRRGYATTCVAALTRRMFEEGRRLCFLYTDRANPTSNRIYAAIGYVPVCDCEEWIF